MPEIADDASRFNTTKQNHGLAAALDQTLIEKVGPALARGEKVRFAQPIRNVNRTVGTMLGHELTKIHGGAGLPEDTIEIDFTGSAGNSFGAFVPKGITLRLQGDANDYVGKGLSGGRIVVRPHEVSSFDSSENVVAGNVIGYGATSGEIFLRGRVGERFCVRNSGATAVVEGVGDHGCEYMTGGRVIVLGKTGRNFGAGMSGGVAYVYSPDGSFDALLNREMTALEPLEESDRDYLTGIIGKFVAETGSEVGQKILANPAEELKHFSKVMPTDYRKVLNAIAAAEAAGRDVDEAIMESARG
jgi:glutamate synthase (NADPH/NADH) large chain